MSKRDVFGDEVNKNSANDFASMFENSLGKVGSRLKKGDSFTGEILSIGKEESFLSTPASQDAVILNSDLLDENKVIKYKVGDRIDVVVVNTKGDEVRVSVKGSRKSNQDMDSLQDAFEMEMPVEGRVTEVVNGGFRVEIQKKLAFCPMSQMDFKVTDAQTYLNQKFDFIVTKIEQGGRNIVVSRRQLLELNRAEKEGTFLESVKTGDILTGKVSRIEKFGAFVDLGDGLDGLVHISELGWSRVQDPSEVVSVGQTVSVMVLKVEDLGGRLKISLSIKQAGGEGDPWMKVPQTYPVGSVHKGTIERKEVYGYFVNIGPGVTGLLPKSKWRDSLDPQKWENRKKGEAIDVQVDEILFEQKKMSLGLPQDAEDNSWKSHTGAGSAKSGFNTGLGGLADLLKKK